MAISATAALVATASAAVAGSVALTFSALATHFLVTTAIGAAINALTPKPSISGAAGAAAASSGYTVTQTSSVADQQIVYGKTKIAGVRVFDATTGDNNGFLHRVVAFTGHEIDSFVEIYLNEGLVTGIDGNGFVTQVTFPDGPDPANPYVGGTTSDRWTIKNSPDGSPLPPEAVRPAIRLKMHNGADNQAADATLVSEVTKWTTNHRLRGISYIYARMEFDQNVFPNGVPEITAVIKGKKVFDPRTSTTAWSDNPALCIRDYLTNTRYGLGESADNIDDSLFITAANVCDYFNYPTLTGAKRYTTNGSFTTGATPYDLLSNLLSSMGGLLWYSQGKWRTKPAYWTPSVATFTDDDLRSSIALATRHSRRDNFNVVNGVWKSASTNWQTTDFPPVTNQAFIDADGGQQKGIDLSIPFTTDVDIARRIANIYLERNRQQLTVQASFGLSAFKVQVGDVIKLTNTRFGWTEKEFEVVSWTFGLVEGADLQVHMILREISQSVFDDYSDGVVYERDNTTLPSPIAIGSPTNLTVSGGGFTSTDGTFVNSFIVSWDAPADSFPDYYVLEWRKQGESKYNSVNLKTTEYQISPVEENVTYDIRVKAVNQLGVSGAYAATTAIVGGDTVAPGLPTGITAVGGFKYITVSWTNPTDADLSYIQVYENSVNSTSGATLVGQIWGNQFVRTNLGLAQTRWYFLRAVDYSGNISGFTSGVSGTTTYLDDPDFENGIRTLFEEQNLYPIEDVNGLPGSGILGRKVFNRQDGKLYEWNGSAWVLVVGATESGDIIGQITGTQITDGAISTPKIAANTITGDKIVANTITGGLLATSGIITNSAQINNGLITNAKIQDAAITTAKIGDAQVTNAKIGDTIQSNNFVSGSSGWRILKDGSAEFNGVVISRQLLVDSGSFYVGNFAGSYSTTPAKFGAPRYIQTNINVSSWAGTNKTYLVAIGNTGTVTAATSDVTSYPTEIRWGVAALIFPQTQWAGGAKMWIEAQCYASRVLSTDLTLQWKVYEVT